MVGDCSSHFHCNEETCCPDSVAEMNMLYESLVTQIIPLSSSVVGYDNSKTIELLKIARLMI